MAAGNPPSAAETCSLVSLSASSMDRPWSNSVATLDAAMAVCEQLFTIQRAALELPYPGVLPEPAEPAKKAFGS